MHAEVRAQLAANEARQRAVAEVAHRQRHRIAQRVAAREIEIMEAAVRQIGAVRGRARREGRAATDEEQAETEHLKRRHASLTMLGGMATSPPQFSELPTSVLTSIILGGVHDDLLRWLSLCARVCPEWRLIAQRSPAYWPFVRSDTSATARRQSSLCVGPSGWVARRRLTAGEQSTFVSALARFERQRWAATKEPTEQQQVMLTVRTLLLHIGEPRGGGHLTVPGDLGAQGFCALAAAIQALPANTKNNVHGLFLHQCSLSAQRVDQVFPGSTFPRLGRFEVSGEQDDEAVALVAGRLPSTLCDLQFIGTRCGDAGVAAVAAALPRLCDLNHLTLRNMPAVTDAGWAALAEALPQLSALQSFTIWHDDRGMGSAFALAVASVLPRCALTLDYINWGHTPQLTAAARATLSAAWKSHIIRVNTR
eukprot:SAG31_NODE_1746_length_7364_cov_6.205231_1_plen_424_part_00